MNNRKSMIAKVYRKHPELVLHKCSANMYEINSVAKSLQRLAEAAIECAKTICEAFNKLDWEKLIKRFPPKEE